MSPRRSAIAARLRGTEGALKLRKLESRLINLLSKFQTSGSYMSVERTPLEWMIVPISRYARFSGRASRAEYWWFATATFVISLFFTVIDDVAGSEIGLLGFLFNLAVLIPTISVTVRRLHDTDRSCWWIFPPIVSGAIFGFFALQESLGETIEVREPTSLYLTSTFAFVGSCALLTIFTILRGTRGPNRFGPDPYA